MSNESQAKASLIKREIAIFTMLLFFGLAVMPIGIYVIGQTVFGAFEGAGFGDFFGSISARIRSGDGIAWFLVLSPYLIWQALRGIAFGWRRLGNPEGAHD